MAGKRDKPEEIVTKHRRFLDRSVQGSHKLGWLESEFGLIQLVLSGSFGWPGCSLCLARPRAAYR